MRWIRFLFIIIAIFAPPLYVAITTFNQEMIPTNLVLSIAAAREDVPFPAVIEALFTEIIFEALREAGIRLPKQIGQAVSIVGALVIGQAAVQAGIISAPVVIIVSITGIAAFTIPRYSFANGIRLLRFPDADFGRDTGALWNRTWFSSYFAASRVSALIWRPLFHSDGSAVH